MIVLFSNYCSLLLPLGDDAPRLPDLIYAAAKLSSYFRKQYEFRYRHSVAHRPENYYVIVVVQNSLHPAKLMTTSEYIVSCPTTHTETGTMN